MKSDNPHSGISEVDTSRTLDLNGGNPNCNQGVLMILDNHPQDGRFGIKSDEVFPTMGTRQEYEGDPNTLMILENKDARLFDNDRRHADYKDLGEVSPTVTAKYGTGGNNTPLVTAVDCWNSKEDETNNTLQSSASHNINSNNVVRSNMTVRRLTPLECERLQGFPDEWTNIGEWTDSKGKKHKPSDAPRYKALGNSIALPFWQWLAGRMVETLKSDGVESPTMASLFDGIGGFPLVFSRCGCSPIWASEIEEFPVAVTKKHFPDQEGNK